MQDSVVIKSILTCGSFHAGGTVRGHVKVESPRHLYIEWGVAQVHGHLCVDSNVLTIPYVNAGDVDESLIKSLSLPDVKSFSGPTGVCIYQSKPTVLYSEIEVPLTTHSPFAIGLPKILCPSFRGTSARAFYVLSFTFKFQGTAACQCLHVPFEIYSGAYFFRSPIDDVPSNKSFSSPLQLTSPTDDNRATPVAVRHGHEIPFELKPRMMHGRVDTERFGGTQSRHFTIGQDTTHIVVVRFTKQRYMPGDEILVAFDFSAATLSCDSITATLHLEERLGALSLDPGRIVSKQTLYSIVELTADAIQTHMRFTLAMDAKVSIETDLVEHKYSLAVDFETSTKQEFRWEVPVQVVPPLVPDPTHFNVPDPVYNGPTRSRKMAVLEA